MASCSYPQVQRVTARRARSHGCSSSVAMRAGTGGSIDGVGVKTRRCRRTRPSACPSAGSAAGLLALLYLLARPAGLQVRLEIRSATNTETRADAWDAAAGVHISCAEPGGQLIFLLMQPPEIACGVRFALLLLAGLSLGAEPAVRRFARTPDAQPRHHANLDAPTRVTCLAPLQQQG